MTKPIQLAMLIDDEEIDVTLYTRVLERSGLVEEVVSFTNAHDALDVLDSGRRPDVILLDINMPGMNGFQFLEVASETLGPDFAKSVVVMLTTSLLPKDRALAESFDVVRDFISKPLDTEQVQRIAAMLSELD